jgi:hypothetical protein
MLILMEGPHLSDVAAASPPTFPVSCSCPTELPTGVVLPRGDLAASGSLPSSPEDWSGNSAAGAGSEMSLEGRPPPNFDGPLSSAPWKS